MVPQDRPPPQRSLRLARRRVDPGAGRAPPARGSAPVFGAWPPSR